MHLLFNLLLGIVPTLVLGASIAAGTEDDRHHRRVFLLVYGLWALTLALWNWMRSTSVWWVVMWSVAGVTALAIAYRGRE
ncbi:MAG TPA: hypothetical protein VFL80_05230 [Thermoanaerobaculia bacterium]|nr:hypothetical protein [Thermoanaerobaculia bacterium]